nr:DUF664 domain-containing protein [Angustibacter aerolatus]
MPTTRAIADRGCGGCVDRGDHGLAGNQGCTGAAGVRASGHDRCDLPADDRVRADPRPGDRCDRRARRRRARDPGRRLRQLDRLAGVARLPRAGRPRGRRRGHGPGVDGGRLGRPVRPGARSGDTGYGHSAEQVAAVRAPSDLLAGYAEAVSQRTLEYVQSLTDDDLERVVDTRWDPPVTLGVRLASVVGDDLQHLGQAAYARGLLT